MIHKLKAKCFQSHDDTEIEFAPGVNTIVGSSDKGKSALMRAFYWVLTNRPSGTSVISHWAMDDKKITGECSVEIQSDVGTVIRRRNSKFNGYEVDGEVLEAVGTDVPLEVDKVLNFEDVNIQRQLDAPFLLSESPGEVARFLNRVVDLEEIDHAISIASSKRLDTQKKINAINKEIPIQQHELDSFDWVDGAERVLVEVEKAESNLTQANSRKSQLESKLQEMNTQCELVSKLSKISDLEPKLNELKELSKKTSLMRDKKMQMLVKVDSFTKAFNYNKTNEWVAAADAKLNEISPLLKKISLLKIDLKQIKETKVKFNEASLVLNKSISFDKAEVLLDSVKMMESKKATKALKVGELKKGLDLHSKALNYSATLTETIKKLEDSRPELCPTCSQPVKESV